MIIAARKKESRNTTADCFARNAEKENNNAKEENKTDGQAEDQKTLS